MSINPLASGASAHNYGNVNTETTSPGEVKELIQFLLKYFLLNFNCLISNYYFLILYF